MTRADIHDGSDVLWKCRGSSIKATADIRWGQSLRFRAKQEQKEELTLIIAMERWSDGALTGHMAELLLGNEEE